MFKRINLLFIVFAVSFLTVFISCNEKSSTEPDVTPPQVEILNPSSGTVLTAPVNIEISAMDNGGISKIVVLLDGDTLGILLNEPFKLYWNVGYWADGQNHTLLAVAEDKSGNKGQSGLINVTVSEDAKISPILLNPINGTAFAENDPVNFLWGGVLDAETYELSVSNTPDFSNELINQICTDTTFTDYTLTSGVYFWRVRSANESNQYSAWSDSNKFSKGSVKWSTTLDRGLSDWGNHLAETIDGGYIIIGPSYSDSDSMEIDMWLNKLDFSGNQVWDRVFGDPGSDFGNWVGQASDGGYYLFGGHSETASQMWLIRTDESGNKLWDKKYGHPDSSSWGYKGSIAGNDYVFIVGRYNNQAAVLYLDSQGNIVWEKTIEVEYDSYPIVRSVTLCMDGGIACLTDNYLVKIDQNGNILWYKEIAHTSFLYSVIQTVDGGYVFTIWDEGIVKTDASGNEQWRYEANGEHTSVADIPGTGIAVCGATVGGNVFLMVRDYNNNPIWYKEYIPGIATTVIRTNSGGFVLTGSTSRWGDNDSDIFVIKTDENGNTEGLSSQSNYLNKIFRKKSSSKSDPFIYFK